MDTAIRRVRRSSTTERQDPKGGGDNAAYDNWDGMAKYRKIPTATSAQRELLLSRHTDKSKLIHTPGDCITDGTRENG